MTQKRRSMAMVGMLLLYAIAATPALAAELDGIPTIELGQVVNSRDWVQRALPWFCREPNRLVDIQAPKMIARPIVVTPFIFEGEEEFLGFTP
ncbi:hypothetical protein [Blastopirellula marina]|uniref:Uncharacterized protein n=1 Tax=Blastopirellula marina TaxID=124 RepID=A0A2S8GPF5_9BACT|nr:hypothetical protein [Blastopirellula marina]PQO46310.1 hypothetical protein C5Y93_10015 [Blastopirellula marina]